MTMINKNQTKHYVKNPWPYVVIDDFFEPEIADRIIQENTLQKWAEKDGSQEYLNSIENEYFGDKRAATYRNQRINYFPKCGIDIEDNGFIDSVVDYLMGYEGKEYLSEIVESFRDVHRPLRTPHDTEMGGFHWVYCMNDATDKPTNYGMGVHTDIPYKLMSGMIYVRHEDDIETGTEIFELDQHHHTIPNTHNTAFFWPNIVGVSYHKIFNREPSPYRRQFFNLSLWRAQDGLDYSQVIP